MLADLHHPAADEEIKDRAEQVFAELKPHLSRAALAAAQEKGRAETLDHYVGLLS